VRGWSFYGEEYQGWFCKCGHVIREHGKYDVKQVTYTTRNPVTVRSRISSSYLSFSSGFGGARSARIALRSPEPD
jgi:hypothetical protein